MKLFLIGLGSVIPEHVHIAEELAKRHQILYWLYMDFVLSVEKSKYPGTFFHEYRDALKGISAEGVDVSSYPPWSREQLASYAAVESEILSMMDKWHPDWPVLKRKDFFYELLRYWGGVLEEMKPDAILFVDVPHQMFDFVLYEIAKRKGIHTVILDPVFKHDRLIAYADYRAGNASLATWREHARTVTLEELAPETRDFYLEVSGLPNPTPAHFTAWRRENNLWNKIRRRSKSLIPFIKDGTIIERGVMRIIKTLKANVKDEHRALEQTADFSLPYVYLPLHYQPEITTSPQGGVFVDQVHMARMLSAALPSGWQLFIKEHPAQWMAHGGDFTAYRYKGFYTELASLPNTRLVPIGTGTFELTDNAKAVATATGTAALEAVLRGKHALTFGYPWFMHAPGIFRVQSVAECNAALQRVAESGEVSKEEVLRFLKAVEEATFRGYITGEGSKVARYAKEDSWQQILIAVENELTKKA